MTLLIGWLDAAVVGTCCALLLFAVSRRIPMRPAVRHLLWLVVALRFLVPSGPSWSWSPWPSPLPSVSAWASFSSTAAPELSVGRTGPTSGAMGTSPAAPANDLSLGTLLLAAWLASALLMLLVRLGRYRKLRIAVERGSPAPSDLRDDLREVARMMDAKTPSLVLSEHATAPMIVGCASPMLVWPMALQQDISRPGRRAVLAHELAHLRRHDPWLAWIDLLVGAVWWWYPPAYLVRSELSAAAEEACDDWAVSLFPDERRSYAEALCDVIAGTSSTSAPALATSMSGMAGMKRRLEGIVRHRYRPAPGWTGYGAALAAGLAVLPVSAFAFNGASPADTAPDMAGIIGRGAAALGSSGQPIVGEDGWIVAFWTAGTEIRVVFATPGQSTALDGTGRATPLGAADRAWLTWVADSTDWTVDPGLVLSSSGAFVPDGPHMHRPTARETVAVWSSVPEPFLADGSVSEALSLDDPLVVVIRSEAGGDARLYRLWRDERGIVHGEAFEAAGRRTLSQADRLVRTISAGVEARD